MVAMVTDSSINFATMSLKRESSGKRVCGLILVDDQISTKSNFNTREPEYKNFNVLGSVIIDKDSSNCDDLRKLIVDQLREKVPKSFGLLTKEGWPLLRSQENKLKAVSVINENNVIAVQRIFDRPRIGIINQNNDCLGFIFMDYFSNLKQIRQAIDALLQELSSKPCRVEYRFIERNGWPVSPNQEPNLTGFDVIVNHNILVKVRSFCESLTNGQVTEVPEDPPTFALPAPENLSIKPVTSQPHTDNTDWKRRSKRGLLKRQTTRRKLEKPFKLRQAKSNAKLIMISYARQEAAQHALHLKRELITYGYSVYLDVDEIKTGTDWQDSLNEAVTKCEVFVPLVTPMYGKTQWTNREVKLADLLHKTIIPINFLEQWPPECLAIQFATTQYIYWKQFESEQESFADKDSDIKIWHERHIKRVTKLIAEQIPSRPTSVVVSGPIAPGLQRSTRAGDAPSSGKRLIVISAHPRQLALVKEIKDALEEQYEVWTTTEGTDIEPSVEPIDGAEIVPANLPTILENTETVFNDAYRQIARQLVESKRPVSLPAPETAPLMDKRRLLRMISQISDVSHISSITPDKMEKLKTFEAKVTAADLVIVIASESYFKSRTSRQHAYYCEHRKQMVVVRCDRTTIPSWFSMLLNNERPVCISDSNYMEALKNRIRHLLDPSYRANSTEMQESKILYLVNYMKKNLPVLDTCVHVVGSTQITNTRSEEICRAIGIELAKVKNVTLVTSGLYGAGDLVARAFYELKQKEGSTVHERNSHTNSFQSSVVHILPLKDSQDLSGKCKQNSDGTFEALPYGQTMFLGESMKERETAVARLLNTCILIEGGPGAAHEAQEFMWNDHYVIPVVSTGGAASGEFGVPAKIFECPVGVSEEDWKNLSDKEVSPEAVAKSVVKIVIAVKRSIASYKCEATGSKVGKGKNKSIRRKKPQEKLDVVGANNLTVNSDTLSRSPDKVLPVVDIDTNDSTKVKTNGKWKRMQRFITFSKHC